MNQVLKAALSYAILSPVPKPPLPPFDTQKDHQESKNPLPIQSHSKKYLIKALRRLIYLTVSYYLCQLMIGTLYSSRSMLAGAKDIPNQSSRRILEEFQEEDKAFNSQENRLTSIAQLKGAEATVVSKDGNKIFLLSLKEEFPLMDYDLYTLYAKDVSDPLAIKTYRQFPVMINSRQCSKSLTLSSDSNTLFLVDCESLTVYNLSTSTDAGVLSTTSLGSYDPRSSGDSLSVALSEEEDAIIIINDDLQIFNITDLKNPTIIETELFLTSGPIVSIPKQRKALVGGQEGLSVVDISDLQNPVVTQTILGNEFVISISLSSDQSTAFVGVFNKTLAQNQKINQYHSWTASLAIYNIDLNSLEPRNFIPINQLKSCFVNNYTEKLEYVPEIKMTSDSEYAYWACDQDYGYVEVKTGKVSRFLSEEPINAIALAHNDRILLRADSEQTDLYALYQSIERNNSFIWKPTSLAQLKFNSSSQTLLTSKMNRRAFIINESTLQVYDTSKNIFSLLSTIQLEIKPTLSVPSNDGKRLYMKTDERTIQILDLSNPKSKNSYSISFPQAFDDYFVVSPDDQIIFASQKLDAGKTAFFAANISDISNPEVGYLKVNGKPLTQINFKQLLVSKDSKTLVIFNDYGFRLPRILVTNLKEATMIKNVTYNSYRRSPNSLVLSPFSDLSYLIATKDDLGQKEIQFLDLANPTFLPALPIPRMSGNSSLEVSPGGNFLYMNTPEYLIEINVTNTQSPHFSRLMQLSIQQFSLTEDDDTVMYAVIGDYLEIIELRSKYSLASIREEFPLGTAYTVDLQLLSRNSRNKYDPFPAKHKYLTASFYEVSFSAVENEPIVSYSILPSWVTFDKILGRVFIEPKVASLLGSQYIHTTGSIQLPSSAELISSLSFLNNTEDSDNLMTDLKVKGYLDESRFLTTKFNAYQKLSLKKKYSQFENEIRYFLRNYLTNQEFAFQVTSSLFICLYPQRIFIQTPSLHPVTVKVDLYKQTYYLQSNIEAAQILQRAFSVSRSVFNEYQTELTLEGSLLNINKALQEVVIDLKNTSAIEAFISVSDDLNSPVEIWNGDISQYFRINSKPLINSTIQTQINKVSLVSGQSFSININPKIFSDMNDLPLTYALDTKLEWLDLSGLVLTGTPPRKLWPFQVDVTLRVANEFKSEKVTFSLYVGMSAVIVLQYVILYFGYAFSTYKAYKNFPKFYNILAQKFYRYGKIYQVSVDQEVTDATILPIGFFGKEFENADLLMKYLKKHLVKDCKNIKDLIDYFKDEQRHGRFDKNKLIATINQTLESLTFEEKHSVKYYIQVNDDQKDIIHRIILDQIILSEISLEPEKQTYNMFKNIKDQWINIVEQEVTSQPYFKVNRSKLNYVLQNFNSKIKPSRPSEYSLDPHKDELLDMTNSSIRSRYMSDSHLFEKSANNIEESLLEPSLNDKLKNVNIDLLELALQAHAFKSHHLNAQREQVTIISNQRKVGSSCFYKTKALFRKHLEKLHFTNKEEIGYGLKYVFQKDVLHFSGTPEPKMEFETLVVQILNKKEMIIREIYIFGAENKNRRKDHIEQVQEQL